MPQPSIKRRHILILLIALVQAACLCVGMTFFSSWLRSSMQSAMQTQALADNVMIAGQMSKLIERMGVSDLRRNRSSWNELQTAIRDIKLPNDGFVCVVDAEDGRLLCHPALKAHSAIAAPMQKPGMQTPGMQKPVVADAAAGHAREVQGSIGDYYGEIQIIAAAFMPKLNAHVKVHQKAAGIRKTIDRLLAPLLPVSIVVCLGLVGCTSALIVGVMRRYDYHLAAINEQLEDLVEKRTESLCKTRDAVIFGLAKLAESRDNDTGQHLERIRLYVSVLAAQLRKPMKKADRAYVEKLALASSLHDIGKVGVPDQILLKPGGFTFEERQIMETHSKLGGDCLHAIGEQLGEDDFLQLSREIAYCHHEKWDGSGYPFGLAGESIPIAARIVALADVYDALRARRPYKQPMGHEQAKAIIQDGRGSHFDPQVVDAFVACDALFIDIADRYASKQIVPQQPTMPTEALATV